MQDRFRLGKALKYLRYWALCNQHKIIFLIPFFNMTENIHFEVGGGVYIVLPIGELRTKRKTQ